MNYRPEIDGLRAVAVVCVLLFHAGFSAFAGGFVGVDVFFVISGYLITGVILVERAQGRFSFVGFYERRVRRILPALFFVMLAAILAAWLWLLPSDMKAFAHSVAAVALFLSNVLFWRQSGYFDTAAELKPLLHTWSLAVEEQYYLLFPLFIVLLWRFGRRWLGLALAVLLLASLALAAWGVAHKPELSFYLLPTRGWELLIGALIAVVQADGRGSPSLPAPWAGAAGLLGLGLILYAVLVFDATTPFPGLHALVPTVGSALVILFARPENRLGRLLGSRPAVGLGLISYSLYLWHQPLFAFARHRVFGEPGPPLALALLAASVALAWASWRWVEMPFRRRGAIGRRQVFGLAAVASAGFVAFGAAGHLTQGFAFRWPQTIIEIDANSARSAYCHDLLRRSLDACPTGSGRIEGALVGDSYAGMLGHAMGRALAPLGTAFWVYEKGGCPPVLGLERADTPAACARRADAVFRQIAGSPELRYVVLLARWTVYLEGSYFDNGEGGVERGGSVRVRLADAAQPSRQAILEAYRRTVRAYLDAGKVVFLVYPVPEVGWDVPRRLMQEYLATGRVPDDAFLSTASARFRERNAAVYAAFDGLAAHPNLRRVLPARQLCDSRLAGRCIAHDRGTPLYYDDDHLSDRGARFVVDEVVRAMAGHR